MTDPTPSPEPTEPIVSLTAKTLLARINPRIVELRRMLAHDHRDEDFFPAVGGAATLQSERAYLRIVANLLHVERAHQRGRVHGTRFATLDEQREWLASMEHRRCASCARPAGLPDGATLAKLRVGELLDLPRPAGAP